MTSSRRTLLLVESPAQLLHAAEWCHANATGSRALIVVLAPPDEWGRHQLARLADLVRGSGLPLAWYEPRRRPGAALEVVGSLREDLRTADRLVVGDPFSGLVQAMLPLAAARDVVVVDDGASTVEFAEHLGRREPLMRWSHTQSTAARWVRRPLATRALAFFTPSRRRTVGLFTVMPTPAVSGLWVQPNGYEWTRSRFAPPRREPGVDIVGTSLVETGLVSEDDYAGIIAGAVAGRRVGRYFAHRREDPARLGRLAARFDLTVVRPELPLELVLAAGPVPQRLLSFPSSVVFTLPVVLRRVGIRIDTIDVSAALASGIDQRARRFITGLPRLAGTGGRAGLSPSV